LVEINPDALLDFEIKNCSNKNLGELNSMPTDNISILAINAGSSSIKFGLFEVTQVPVQVISGKIQRIGSKDASFTVKHNDKIMTEEIAFISFPAASTFLIDWLERQNWFPSLSAIGHRLVYGMKRTGAEIITGGLLEELNDMVGLDPEHLPAEIYIVQTFQKKYPRLIQAACFDTAFHSSIPLVAKMFAIPKKYWAEGIQRYGFHGISYSYLMQQLISQDPKEAKNKIVMAHLGNGASIAAVKGQKCIDTSMGFTPASGIVMSTRSGDLDPGIVCYLMNKGLDAKALSHLVNHQSGLLGISGLSSDMTALLQLEKDNEDAALAVQIFCYQAVKYIGAYAAALNGLDTLVFAGGIGENAASIRARICANFNYLGAAIDEEKNNRNDQLVSTDESAVKIYVMATDEEFIIAKETAGIVRPRINHQ